MFFWRVHLSPISFQDKENWTKMLSFVSQSPLTIAIEKICVCEHFKITLLQFKFQAKIDTCFEVISIATFKTFLRIFDQVLVSPIKKCHKRHKCVCKCKRRFLLRREKNNLDLRSKNNCSSLRKTEDIYWPKKHLSYKDQVTWLQSTFALKERKQ